MSIKPLFSQPPAFSSHGRNQSRVFHELHHCVNQSRYIPYRHQKSVDTVIDRFTTTGRIGRDDRAPHGHRLLRAARHTFAIRRQHKNAGLRQPWLYCYVPRPFQYALFDPAIDCRLIQTAGIGVKAAQQDKTHVRMEPLDASGGFCVFNNAFFFEQSGDKQKCQGLCKRRRQRPVFQGDANSAQIDSFCFIHKTGINKFSNIIPVQKNDAVRALGKTSKAH